MRHIIPENIREREREERKQAEEIWGGGGEGNLAWRESRPPSAPDTLHPGRSASAATDGPGEEGARKEVTTAGEDTGDAVC